MLGGAVAQSGKGDTRARAGRTEHIVRRGAPEESVAACPAILRIWYT